MKAFVTGSTGLLGNNLVRRLLDGGHTVKALVRDGEKAKKTFGRLGLKVVHGDMGSVAAFADALSGCDVLFHTAAYFRESFQPGEHWPALEAINVSATIDLLTAAEAHGIRKAIYVSSAGVIGLKPSQVPGDESTPPHPVAQQNPYLRSKILADAAVADFVRTHALEVVTVLPGGMMGPGDAAPTFGGQFIIDFMKRKIPAIPDGGFCVVDARDVADVMIAAVEKAKNGERYIVGGRFFTAEDLLKALQRVTGVPAPRWHVPYSAATAFAKVGEVFARLTGTKAQLSVDSIRIMHQKLQWTSEKAARELGARFRPLEETLRDEVEWYRAHAYI